VATPSDVRGRKRRLIVLSRHILLALGLGLLLLWVFGKSLPLSYLSDDFDQVQLVAEIRAGLRPWHELLTRPYHGQLVVLLRLLFWFGTRAGQMGMAWVRSGVLAVHGTAALGCGILCARWTRSGAAGCLGAVLYACAAGFVGDVVSWPSSSIFCLGATFYIWALVALSSEGLEPAPKFILSEVALILAFLGMNAEIVAAISLSIYCWAVMPRQRLWQTWAPITYILTAAMLGVVWRQAASAEKLASLAITPKGAMLGAWLLTTAPLRFAASWTGWSPGFPAIPLCAGVAWLALLVISRFLPLRQCGIALALWAPAICIAFVTGFARSSIPGIGPGVLYVSDRYYYCFLFPLVVTSAFLLDGILDRFPAGRPAVYLLLAGVLLAAVVESRQRYLDRIPAAQYAMARQALDRGALLIPEIQQYLDERGRARPLRLKDGRLPLDGAHLNTVSIVSLIYSMQPGGIRGVQFGTALGESEEQDENSILAHWAVRAGFGAPVVRLTNGIMANTKQEEPVDFGRRSFEEALVEGFSWWEKPFRWVTGDASLRLRSECGGLVITAYAPIDELRRKFPGLRSIDVAVSLNNLQVGRFSITQSAVSRYLVPPGSCSQPGTVTVVGLRPSFIWHARDINANSFDDRDLSFALEAIRFETPETAERSDDSDLSIQGAAAGDLFARRRGR